MGLVQEGRGELGEHVECLQDAVEGGEEDDAGEEEGDLAGPGELVEGWVDVFGEEGEDAVYGVGGGGGEGGGVGGGEEAPEGGKCCAEDAVDAVDCEAV